MPSTGPERPPALEARREANGVGGSGREPVHVVAGALVGDHGRVLVSRRPPGVHQGGLWEFPGGKLEAGEDRAAGLARELREELGVRVIRSRPLIRVAHDYGDRSVLLDVWRVDAWAGSARGLEGQTIAWRPAEALDPACFPAADRPVITALRLPAIMGWLDAENGDVLPVLERALDRGLRIVCLRRLGRRTDADGLARAAVRAGAARGARLLVDADPALARRAGAAAVLMPVRDLALARGERGLMAAAACHTRHELGRARSLGAQLATLEDELPADRRAPPSPLPAGLPVYLHARTASAGVLSAAWAVGAQGLVVPLDG